MRALNPLRNVVIGSLTSLVCGFASGAAAQTTGGPITETIVMVRHAEKPSPAIGQLNCQGLNRALALPAVLARFGHPAAIFAPNPSIQTTEGNPLPGVKHYSYIRPLATIEPYAIAQDMPVDTQLAASDISGLEHEILKPEYANSLVVIAWEHILARHFAEAMLKTFNQDDAVPEWRNSDYETMYIFRISNTADGKRMLTFAVEHENLNGLPKTCPVILPPVPPTPEMRPAPAPPATP